MATALEKYLEPRAALFTRLWGLALTAHVIGNHGLPDIPDPVGWVNLLVGLGGIALMAWPGRRLLLVAAGLTVVSVILEMPFTGNHWVVAGLVSMAILVTGGRPGGWTPATRMILLVFYSFAALAKLNAGFFDPEVSCALFYANQWLDGFGVGSLPAGGIVAKAVILGTVLVELSVPILLLVPRARMWGVLIGTGFHTMISFDLNQHFYDFTAVLVPLFFLFVPDVTVDKVNASITSALDKINRSILLLAAVAGAALVVAANVPLPVGTLPSMPPFLLWIPLALGWLVLLWRTRSPGQPFSWSLRPLAAVVVVITALNGIAPYLEVKTAQSFNMYANLITAGGESNHLIVRRTWPIRDGYVDPVTIVASSDPNLEVYRAVGYLIAYPEFTGYLASRPETAVTYSRGGVQFEVARAGDVPALSSPAPWWSRFLGLRAIDGQRPPRCQDQFFAAL